jgi:hypothetical protein
VGAVQDFFGECPLELDDLHEHSAAMAPAGSWIAQWRVEHTRYGITSIQGVLQDGHDLPVLSVMTGAGKSERVATRVVGAASGFFAEVDGR